MEGTYEILGVIGRSGLGTLYQARYKGESGFAKLVTLKMLDEGVADSDEIACRLRDEARVLGCLKHQAIVQVDRLARLGGRWTLVQEHVEGVSLDTVIEQGPMPTGPALEVIANVAGALHAAFTASGPDGSPLRLQHRDIKPSAILVDSYGGTRVMDFGIARACFSGREARTRSFVVGSFEYMAPERLALEEGGPWSDIYSLGQVLYALLAGRGFGRSHPSERHHKAIIDKATARLLERPGGVPEGVLELLLRMLAMEPHVRPDARSVERSCTELVRALADETLRAWAEYTVEPMVQARDASSQGGLVGEVLREGEEPQKAPPPVVPDPSLVASPRAVQPRTGPKPKPKPGRELEPLPVHTFAEAPEDDATEIMVRPGAGEEPASEDDGDSTEVFSAAKGPHPALMDEPDPIPPGRARFGALELDEDVRPTTIEEPPEEPDEGMVGRPTSISPMDDELLSEVAQQGPVEVTAVTPAHEEPFAGFFDPAGSLDEATALGEDIETARAERDPMAQVRFDQPAGSLDQPTALGQDIRDARGETASMARVRFDQPAGSLDVPTALGPDPETQESDSTLEARPRFSEPAGSLDEATAIGADIQREERAPAMARVQFDAPETVMEPPARPLPPAQPLPPALDMPPLSGPAAPAPPTPEPALPTPEPALPTPEPEPSTSAEPPPAPEPEPSTSAEPPPAPEPPAPPPPPPSMAQEGDGSDRPTHSQAKPWSPEQEVEGQARPQLDFWEPPSFDTLSGQLPPSSPVRELTPAPMPDPAVRVNAQLLDEPAPPAVEVQVEDEPVPAPTPPTPAPEPAPLPPLTEGVEPTVARSDRVVPVIQGPVAEAPSAAAPARAPKKKGKGKLLLIVGVLLLLGVLLVLAVAGAGAAWYFLL